jgi:predicted dinucleotide-binding enzyme
VRIGIIGAGHIGGTLARHFVDAEHEVAVSNSHGPATLHAIAEELGPRAQALTRLARPALPHDRPIPQED